LPVYGKILLLLGLFALFAGSGDLIMTSGSTLDDEATARADRAAMIVSGGNNPPTVNLPIAAFCLPEAGIARAHFGSSTPMDHPIDTGLCGPALRLLGPDAT
jgi:hypothetical protein